MAVGRLDDLEHGVVYICAECLIDATCRPGQTCDANGTCVGGVTDGGTPDSEQPATDAGQPADDTGTRPGGEDAAPAEETSVTGGDVKNPYGCACATIEL